MSQENSPLTRAIRLGELLVEQQAQVKALTAALAEAKERAIQTEQEDLPELMRELELEGFSLKDGTKIELSDDLSCAITEANRNLAHRWLDENGFGGLIKTVVSVDFNREDRELALELAKNLQEIHALATNMKESVHSGTLKSFVREELEKGNVVPFDLFSVHPYSKAKVKLPKKKGK